MLRDISECNLLEVRAYFTWFTFNAEHIFWRACLNCSISQFPKVYQKHGTPKRLVYVEVN